MKIDTFRNRTTIILRENKEILLKPSHIIQNETINEEHLIMYETSFQLTNEISTNMIIYIVSQGINEFSFSLHTIKESSLIHTLYRNKLINYLIFSLANLGVNDFLHIGVPNEYKRDMKYKGKITIRDSFPTRGFYLSSLTYQNNTYIINKPCIIRTDVDYLFVYPELYKILKEKIFMNFPLSENCRVNDVLVGYNYRIKWIECNFNEEQEKEAITFQFGNNLYINITLKDMFTF